MVRLSSRRRGVLAEKLPDLANLIGGGLIVGQFLGPGLASGWLLALALAIWCGFMGLAMFFAEDVNG